MAKKPTYKAVSGGQLRRNLTNAMGADPALGSELRDRLASRILVHMTSARFRSVPPELRARPAEKPIEAGGAGAQAAPETSGAPGGRIADDDLFSVVALLAQEGELGLRSRLNAFSSVASLLELARAQRLSLPRAIIEDPAATVSGMRDAIVEAAQKRIANRQAAAG
ncbi:MAG: hypothetical protein GC150_12230 [Rhizobiales bacterium]|nr:hypothetical protein [Hyphomicrobiales bacterium]